ncbi:minor capsid protein [Lactobacillus apis]|uniref:minor capsid protein n=1 Tax=Lactobacillus apis TaxID=303541 RepID=UPI00164F40C7|nr:minor capsid protein [Lactobacillus apis]MBC6360565.1 phage head morphogenesis protein [Lactobacillus apis]
MTTKREVDYWKRRFLYEKEQQLQNTAEYEAAMRARLKEVEHVLEQEVDYWLKRYAANQEITIKDARKILSTIGTRDWHMTLKEFKAKAKAGGFDKELDAEYFRSQLSRLENIDEQLTSLLAQYATSESDKLESSLVNQYQQTYMHSIYLTQLEKAKLSSNFANVNEYQVKAIVHKPWRGSDFSKRIWKSYTETLPNELGDALLRGSVLGHSHEQIFKMMRQRLKDVEDYQLHRLIITEMGHVAETATADAYKEEGVERYQYLATLESHTCDECAHLDEKVFDLKDKVEGLNYPLIHPYCRCTTMPYIEGLPDVKDRWARDPETGKGYYVDNMDFETWKNAIDYQRKAQNIPNTATRYIKTGKFDWNQLNAEQYNKHVKGTPEFDNYAKGRKRPISELVISPSETQALINKYGKKRESTNKNQILFKHESYIGMWSDINGNLYPTKKGRVSYRKNKGAHITPVRPDYLI